MKKLNLTVLVFFLVIMSCKGQSTEIDTFNGNLKIINQITFGDTKQAAENAFGQPDDITTEYWEMSEETVTVYHYNNDAALYFGDDGLESFKLTSSNYYLQMGSFKLKVGNNISSLQNPFPKSYSFRNSGGTSIALGTGDHRFLLIEYNSNNVIINIEERIF